ncbi:ASCH domain-containing protein [Cupriavidus basilensis]|uniref:ASCH domain-containing protein n=1 Tax=Cupriavidus basilensis TaxID=68895 RepID=UPI0005BC94BE|nr:ASCH domain-containing protein [Cupriavidus basilensis]
MKVLSVRQPWAWLIVNGHKDIENRTWPTKYRGRLLIHASKGMTRADYEAGMATALAVGFRSYFPRDQDLERGGIVGIATLTDCLRDSSSPWHMPDCWGFKLTEARPIPLMPMTGRLNIFDAPQEIIAALARS